MNATHFRRQAEKARDLARSGDDPRLTQMLLEVANEMDAEADAIEAAARPTTTTPKPSGVVTA